MEKNKDFKYSYLGYVTDYDIIKHKQVYYDPPFDWDYVPTEEEKKKRKKKIKIHKEKRFKDRQEKFFCSCGNSFLLKLEYKVIKKTERNNEWASDLNEPYSQN